MDEIADIVLMFFATFLLSIFHVYCWKNLLKEREKYKIDIKNFVLVLLCTFATGISNLLFPQPFRLIIIYVLLMAINYFLISKNLKNSVILVIISEIIIWLSEFSFAIVLSLFYKGDVQEFTQNSLVFLGLNTYIVILSFVLHKIGLTKKLYKLLMPKKNKNEDRDYIIYSIITIVILIVATMETYMKISFMIVIITNTIMALVFLGIIIMSRKLKVNYDKISSKYETSISSLKEYEVMIDKFRVDTHENKNEILTIRNMIKEGNDKETLVKYIDKLVDNKIKDNDKIMKKTAKIPAGGLRATIYSKLCLMDKLKIKYRLNISREVRTTDFINLDEGLVLKICKILGVFLDNAVEAVKPLKKKEISVEMYVIDNKLCIDITNNFNGNLDLDKINNMKYTTKGDGHGYGLTLVSKLLEEETEKLENEKSINRDNFTQTLKIKM